MKVELQIILWYLIPAGICAVWLKIAHNNVRGRFYGIAPLNMDFFLMFTPFVNFIYACYLVTENPYKKDYEK